MQQDEVMEGSAAPNSEPAPDAAKSSDVKMVDDKQ